MYYYMYGTYNAHDNFICYIDMNVFIDLNQQRMPCTVRSHL